MSQPSKHAMPKLACHHRQMQRESLGLRRLLFVLLAAGGVLLPGAIAWADAGSPTPGTVIENQATGTFVDPNLGIQNLESNIVRVTVSEVAGITVSASATVPPTEAPAGVTGAGPSQGDSNIDPEDVIYFTFDITNVGNDPTQFFIPATASATNGTFVGPIQIMSFDPDGSNETVLGVPFDVPNGGIATGAALGLPNGSVAPGGKVTVRVPIKASAGLSVGANVTAILGDTLASGRGNQVYSDGGSAQDLYTQDNQDADIVDSPASPATEVESSGHPNNGDATFHRQEASATQNAPIGPPIVILRDFGDAPDSYATDENDDAGEGVGASHVVNSDTYLGTPPDNETDAQTPLDGSGDGVDEDGIASFPDLFTNSFVYTIDGSDITVTNTSLQPATLHAWIDFDSDGTFESSEHTSISIPANQTTNTAASNLVWSNTGQKTAGTTYARFRLTTDSSITASTPGGAANDGEVEDYQITIQPAPISGNAVCRADYDLVYSTDGTNISAVHTLTGTRRDVTNTATVTVDGLATDHVNRLVYYAEGNTLHAWSPLTDTHSVIDASFPSYIQTTIPAGFNISSGGAAFYNQSLYVGSENASGNLSEIFKVDFVAGSNGQTVQSITAIGIEALVTSGTLTSAPEWGDFIIDDTGLLIANGRATDGFWSYDLSTSTFTNLTVSFASPANVQLAKDGDGNLWGVGDNDIFQVTLAGTTLNEVASTRQTMGAASIDAGECVRGTSSIGDFVWTDDDSDGLADPGEAGLANVTVDLIWDVDGDGTIDANDPVLATQATNTNGNYDFGELIFGDYIVHVTDTNSVLPGRPLTTGTEEIAVTLAAGTVDFNDADFGYAGFTPPMPMCTSSASNPFNTTGYPVNTPLQASVPLTFFGGGMTFNSALSGSATYAGGVQVQFDAAIGDYIFLQPTNAPNYLTTNNEAIYTFTFAEALTSFSMVGSGLNNEDGTTISASYLGAPVQITAANFSNLSAGMTLSDADGDGEMDTVVSVNMTGGTNVNVNTYELNITGPIDTVTVVSGKEDADTNTVTIGLHTFEYCVGVVTTPGVALAKRITAINRGLAGEQLFDTGPGLSYVDAGTTNDADNAVNWPGGAVSATVGGGTVESYISGVIASPADPGDEVEYSIPFLSSGDTTAANMLLCDRIPANTTFIPTGFNGSPPAGPGAGNRGILLNFNGTESALTNANDGDEIGAGATGIGGYYFAPGSDPSVLFPGINTNCSGANPNGVVVVDLSDVPNATGDGVPANSYGFFRFKVQVD